MPQLSNRRHEIFAIELAAGAPLLSAYLTAGYKEGYSARFNASRLRNMPRIRARVAELLQEFGDRARIKLEWVQETVAPLLEIDPAELYEADGADPSKLRLKPLNGLSPRIRRSIQRIRLDESGRPCEFILADKLQAAALLMRSLSPDGPEVNVNVALGERLDASIGRFSFEDQLTLANALDQLTVDGDGAGSVSAGGASAEPTPRRSVTQEAPQPVKIGDRF